MPPAPPDISSPGTQLDPALDLHRLLESTSGIFVSPPEVTAPDITAPANRGHRPQDIAKPLASIPIAETVIKPDESAEEAPEMGEGRRERAAEGAAAIAVSAEMEQPETSEGELILDEMRAMYREGILTARAAVPPHRGEKKYGEKYTVMKSTISEWRSQHPPDDTVAEEIANRFAGGWLKYTNAKKAPELLADSSKIVATLDAYHKDAKYAAQVLGLKRSAVPNAFFNTRAELDQASQASSNTNLTDGDVRYLADTNVQDVLGSIKRYEENTKAVKGALASGELSRDVPIDRATIHRFALRASDPKSCIDRVNKYASDYTNLTATYKDNHIITPARIEKACRTYSNPQKVMSDKWAAIETLLPQYEGKGGLTEADIVSAVFRPDDPKNRLDNCLRNAPGVAAALDHRLTPGIVRDLIINEADPVRSGQKILADIDRLKAKLAANPKAAVLSDADYVFLVRSFGKSAATRGTALVENMSKAREHFAGNRRATQGVIRAASRLQEGDVISNVNYILGQIRRLQVRHAGDKIPSSALEKAVVKTANPEGYIGRFIKNRGDALIKFEGRIPRSVIEPICVWTDQPIKVIEDDLAVIDRMKTLYGNMAHIDDERLVRAAVGSANAALETRKVYAAEIFEEMQDYSRLSPRSGSRAHTASAHQKYVDDIRSQAQVLLKDVLVDGIAPEAVAERFGRLCYSYAKQDGKNPITDPDMLRSLCEHYGKYVNWLAEIGFDKPEAVAQTNNEHKLRVRAGRSEASRKELVDSVKKQTTADVISLHNEYGGNLRKLRRHFSGEKVPTTLLKHFAKNAKANPVASLRAHLKKTQALSTVFEGVKAVDSRVRYYYTAHYYTDPVAGVRDFLKRRETMLAIVQDDRDFDQEAVRDLCLQYTKPDHFPDVIIAYKGRLSALREAAQKTAMSIDEDLLREAAVQKTPNVQSRFDRARRRQHARETGRSKRVERGW